MIQITEKRWAAIQQVINQAEVVKSLVAGDSVAVLGDRLRDLRRITNDETAANEKTATSTEASVGTAAAY